MDPLTVSTSFATIVGLVCNFAGEARSESTDHFAEFMESLRGNHENIRRSIDANVALTQALRALLSQRTDVVLEKLEKLDAVLAGVAANLEDFRPLSIAVHYEELVSEEAISILTQFYDSGAGRFLEARNLDSAVFFIPLDVRSSQMAFEYRFLEADLRTLCNLGFLDLDYNSQGKRIFILTRQAERYVKAIRGPVSNSDSH